MHCKRSFAECDKKLCCISISKALKQNFRQNYVLSYVISKSINSCSLRKKRLKTKELDWHGLISNPPSSPR